MVAKNSVGMFWKVSVDIFLDKIRVFWLVCNFGCGRCDGTYWWLDLGGVLMDLVDTIPQSSPLYYKIALH